MFKKPDPPSGSIEKFDVHIDDSVRSRMKGKDEMIKNEPQMVSVPIETQDEDETVQIPVVELFDESGEKVVFELLDTIEYEGDRYPVLTPYYETEEEYDLGSPANVFIMKEVEGDSGDPMLETVEDEALLQNVYSVFKQNRGNEYEFRDS